MHYAGNRTKESAKIINAKGTLTYEVEIKGIDWIFDNNGNFLKKKIKREKECGRKWF